MGDIVNYSVKVDSEQKDLLLKQIEESGKTAGEFIAAMMACYEANQNRETVTDIRELNQLKNFLARIEEIYIGMAKSRKDVEESHSQAVGQFQEQLKAIKAELVDTRERAKLEVMAITEQMNEQQQETKRQHQADVLELTELKDAKERAEEGQRQAQKIADMTEHVLAQLQAQVAELKDKAEASQKIAESAVNELNVYKEQLTTSTIEANNLRSQLDTERIATERTISDLKQQAELDKERAVLAAQREAMQERKELQDDIVRLRDQLAAEREHIAKLEVSKKNPSIPEDTPVKPEV